jgi:hypothetical protein
VSFFLKACTYAGVKTGTHWKTPPAAANGTRRRVIVRKPEGITGEQQQRGDADDSGNSGEPGTDVATVRLRSGGTLTLALAGSSLMMPKDDRNFVFGIVDLMQEYDQPGESSGATDADDEEGAP